MKYLLDTHVFVWFRVDSNNLDSKTLALLKNPKTAVVGSAISTLEMAQLVFSNKLTLPCDAETWTEQTRHQFQAPELPLDSKLAGEAYRLQGDFHEDPADRILVATARNRGWTLVTADRRILSYPYVRKWDAKA